MLTPANADFDCARRFLCSQFGNWDEERETDHGRETERILANEFAAVRRNERERALRLVERQREKYDDADAIQAALDEVHENLVSGWEPSYTAEADAARLAGGGN